MIFAFDTETTALVNAKAPPSHPSQPYLVQLGGLLLEEDGAERARVNLIVRPEGYEIPAAAAAVQRITTELALRVGVPALVVGAIFSNLVKLATHHVAHNSDFDVKVMQAFFFRLKRTCPPLNPRCTMRLSSDLVGLPPTPRMVAAGFDKFKPPNLTELIKFLFNEDLEGAHDAQVDVNACARAYLELVRRGVIADARPQTA
jgi:DNA polymerase-3 subunit epsilon